MKNSLIKREIKGKIRTVGKTGASKKIEALPLLILNFYAEFWL